MEVKEINEDVDERVDRAVDASPPLIPSSLSMPPPFISSLCLSSLVPPPPPPPPLSPIFISLSSFFSFLLLLQCQKIMI